MPIKNLVGATGGALGSKRIMSSVHGTVEELVLQILKDRSHVELQQRNRDLLAHVEAQNEYIENELKKRCEKETRADNVDVRLNVCQFCQHVIPGENIMIWEECPCHEVRYCSGKCRRVDWKRHHRHTCKYAKQQGFSGSLSVPMEQID